MKDLTNSKVFIGNGTSHEKSDFTDFIFKDLDYTQFEQAISL